MGLLIREEVTDVKYLTEEDKSGKKHHFIEGVFCQAEKQNKNGRVYPFATLQREVANYNKNYVSKNRAYGELGHPDTPAINLDRVSHLITKLTPDGHNFIGKAKIVDTPMGNIVKGLLDGGANLGVSTRGVGSLKAHNGYQLVQDDFKLATAADIVADPSAPDAFVRGIMENKQWVYENGLWHEAYIDRAKRQIKATNRRNLDEVALKLFENFITKL